MPTPDAFRWLGEHRGDHAPAPRLLRLDRLASWPAVARLAGNDFEAPVAARVPAVAALAAARDADPPASRARLLHAMTGSGSLTKLGAGIVTLSGSNDYSGGTTVSGGTLLALSC